MKRYIRSSDDEYELETPEQEYTSKDTSINGIQGKIPALYKRVTFSPGDVVVDYGGGQTDVVPEYIEQQFDAIGYVYDPFWRSQSENQAVLKEVRQHGGADAVGCSNVLNVIKEYNARHAVLTNIQKIAKPGAPIYFTVYEGSGKGNEGPTKSGYQLNRKTDSYMEEIQEVFPDAVRHGKLIVAHNS